MPSVLVACDKFKGTATSADVNAAVARAARELGYEAVECALSDGGDGLLEVFGGPDRWAVVTGPLGAPVRAGWRLDGTTAVVESAAASGLSLAGGAEGNDPLGATSRGTGELIEAAARAGAGAVVVGLGGSACTDGGLGALDVLSPSTIERIGRTLELIVCCDVTTRYTEAATVFGPQKGASPEDVVVLTSRLREAADALANRFGVDVDELVGGGAAGGLGGALAAVGGQLRPGFDVVADHVGLDAQLRAAELVVTGEGRLDESSFVGKVVGGVVERARAARVPVVAIVGESAPGLSPAFDVVSLTELVGYEQSTRDVLGAVTRAAREVLSRRRPG